MSFQSDRLRVTTWAYFLYEQKVCKESQKRRGLRFPRLLKTSTLEPPKRNRARFPFDSLQGRAKLRLSSVDFDVELFFTKKTIGNVKHCTSSRGYQKGAEAHFGCCG